MTSSTTARFEAYFDQWLHTLEADTHGGTDARPDTPTRPTAPVRYGEWEGPDGSTRPVRTSRPEWMRNQIDMALALSGLVTPDDVVIVAAPYELSLEGASVERAVEWLGASLISVGTSNTICPVPRLLGLLHRYRATTLVCSPQLAADLAALDEAGGRRPAASSLSTLVTTRPAAPERLRRIADAWGASATQLFATPARPATATPCRAGRLHLVADRFAARLRSPVQGRLDPGGTRGELVLDVHRPGEPAPVAQPTGELVELPAPGTSCPCGSGRQLVVPLGRVADAVRTERGPLTQVDVEHCLFTSPHPRGQVTSRPVGGRLEVTCAVAGTDGRQLPPLRELVRDRFGPAVELQPFDNDPVSANDPPPDEDPASAEHPVPEQDLTEGDTRTRSS
uniref:AMP-dependent synthetase/ligase n=1 Tax=Streptomyces zelensis TaxID=1981977 RepID=A0A1W6EUU2_9ACTN|nr:AMP-dependent synthetase/ligase [Streptomyces zelensis]